MAWSTAASYTEADAERAPRAAGHEPCGGALRAQHRCRAEPSSEALLRAAMGPNERFEQSQ